MERKAAVARARSAHETTGAERHETLAGQAGTVLVRDLCLRIAAIHRSTAACGTRSAALILVGTASAQLALAASDEPARAAQELEFLLGTPPVSSARSRPPAPR